jgi:hypothetical protein
MHVAPLLVTDSVELSLSTETDPEKREIDSWLRR